MVSPKSAREGDMNVTKHKEFSGYNVFEGKPEKPDISPKAELIEHLGKVSSTDLPRGTPPEWAPAIERARLWALHQALSFSISPHEYQIAKIWAEGFALVIWNGKRVGGGRVMKITCEGKDKTIPLSLAAGLQEALDGAPERKRGPTIPSLRHDIPPEDMRKILHDVVMAVIGAGHASDLYAFPNVLAYFGAQLPTDVELAESGMVRTGVGSAGTSP